MQLCLRKLKTDYLEKIPLEINQRTDELPYISVISLFKDRHEFFPLALMNYRGIDYPRDKLEWILVDDGEYSVEELIPKDIGNYQYIRLEESHTVSAKRNIGVGKANYDIICMMDDDDIYQPRRLLIQLAYLKHYKKQICYCSSIGCFHIQKLVSTINVPPISLPPENRVSEATLCFYRDFWKERGFDTALKGEEATTFMKGRYDQAVEMPWKPIIVSLLHDSNLSNRVKNIPSSPNGCHFNLSDDLFKFITNLK